MRERGGRIAAAGALALLAAGCSFDPLPRADPEPLRAGRIARERQINDEWQDHTVGELVEHWGPPYLLLDIPGGGNPPGFVIVYPRDAGTGCLDTFAIMYGEVNRVRHYQCR